MRGYVLALKPELKHARLAEFLKAARQVSRSAVLKPSVAEGSGREPIAGLLI